jgi:hypothetical protein
MSQMNYAAVLSLQRTVDDMANRSYRIREWENLEVQLQNVEKSFKPFLIMLHLVVLPADLVKQAPILAACWTPSHETDIPSLNSFAERLEHIHKPIRLDDANYPDLLEKITSLVTISNRIQHALNDGLLGDLKEQAEAFNIALHGQLANRQTLMRHEVDQLCELTFRLQTHLSSQTPAQGNKNDGHDH